jgi:hypothetical protein
MNRREPSRMRLWRGTGALTFTVGQRPQISAQDLAPGEHEFVAGTVAANEILAGLSVDGRAGEIHAIDRSAPKGSRLTCT